MWMCTIWLFVISSAKCKQTIQNIHLLIHSGQPFCHFNMSKEENNWTIWWVLNKAKLYALRPASLTNTSTDCLFWFCIFRPKITQGNMLGQRCQWAIQQPNAKDWCLDQMLLCYLLNCRAHVVIIFLQSKATLPIIWNYSLPNLTMKTTDVKIKKQDRWIKTTLELSK